MTTQGLAVGNFQELNQLKLAAKQDAKKALPEVAKQFEAIFLQSLLKNMRASSHFLEESSPFRGKNPENFQEMLDAQYVHDMGSSQTLGFAKLLEKQLDPSHINNSHTAMGTTQASARNAPKATSSVEPSNPTVSTSSPAIDEFVASIWDKAKTAASVLGLDPKLLVAQAALETGWGKFIAKDSDGSSSNNLFNVKSGSNTTLDSVTVKTTEYIADTPIKVHANFRKYPSVEDSFKDYLSLIQGNERYKNAAKNAGDAILYVQELSKAGYATDPNYSSKVLSIYRGDELNQAIDKYEARHSQ